MESKMSDDIDIIIPWVDGSDPLWQEKFREYNNDKIGCDARFERYRDWNILRYWFRGIDVNVPWVHKIFFVTSGHIPDWLNINHPKIVIVKHDDYIPSEYLPTFSSHPIELNMHRIEGLSEKFIYFNDDFFILNKVDKEDFFTNGLPNDLGVMNVISGLNKTMNSILLNNLDCINSHFNKRKVLLNNKKGWFNISYGVNKMYRNISLSFWEYFTGFYEHHLPQPFLKKTLYDVWLSNTSALELSSHSKFRSSHDVNQYLFRAWQLCKGDFYPSDLTKKGVFFEISDSNYKEISDVILNSNKKFLVINDGDISSFDEVKNNLIKAFQLKFKNKSSFEM